MMDALIDDLLSQPEHLGGIESYINNLRSKTDLIAGAARNIADNSTSLLNALKDISAANRTIGYAIFLSTQAEYLVDAAFRPFLCACKMFFSSASKFSILSVHQEGRDYMKILLSTLCN